MISITNIKYFDRCIYELTFSDGHSGKFDFSYLLSKDTVLTNPLKDIGYFRSAFIDFGAICWKNGLELSAESLWIKLKNNGKLESIAS